MVFNFVICQNIFCCVGMPFPRSMSRDTRRWILGLSYIVSVAMIWIAASYIVQSVVDAGVSPFLVTYICNSLFLLYIPIVEIGRFFEDSCKKYSYRIIDREDPDLCADSSLENLSIINGVNHNSDLTSVASQSNNNSSSANPSNFEDGEHSFAVENGFLGQPALALFNKDSSHQVDDKAQWTRFRVAKISLFICPFWFFGQLTFNFSLKYTSVTSNTILSSTSSIFTFLVSLAFLGETFTWVKLGSVLLCMGGTTIVSLSDSSANANAVATNPILGDILALVSASLYAVYITMIRAKLPDEDREVQASTTQFLGYLGLFNFLIFLPVVIVLDSTKLESFHVLTWKQLGLIVAKGLLDNVLSDYLQVKATQLTSTTVATAGLSVQVPLAAIIDSLTGHAPHFVEYIGAASIMVGFVGLNIPSNVFIHSQETIQDVEAEKVSLPSELELGRTIIP